MRSCFWRRQIALIGILAAIIAGPLSICVDVATASPVPNTVAGLRGSIGDQILNDQLRSDADSCGEHATYIQPQASVDTRATVDTPQNRSLHMLDNWVALLVRERGVDRPWQRQKRNPNRFFAGAFKPRAPPLG